jgi:hypothetical protein
MKRKRAKIVRGEEGWCRDVVSKLLNKLNNDVLKYRVLTSKRGYYTLRQIL